MTTLLFEGSSPHSQGTLLDERSELSPASALELQRLASSIHQAFSAFDDEGAFLLIEIGIDLDISSGERAAVIEHVSELARKAIRRFDIVKKIDEITFAILLPGSGRIGMTRVADALRQKVWSTPPAMLSSDIAPTVTIGAVHTTEAHLVDPGELLLAARANLDSARAAGGNRTNWSDWAHHNEPQNLA